LSSLLPLAGLTLSPKPAGLGRGRGFGSSRGGEPVAGPCSIDARGGDLDTSPGLWE